MHIYLLACWNAYIYTLSKSQFSITLVTHILHSSMLFPPSLQPPPFPPQTYNFFQYIFFFFYTISSTFFLLCKTARKNLSLLLSFPLTLHLNRAHTFFIHSTSALITNPAIHFLFTNKDHNKKGKNSSFFILLTCSYKVLAIFTSRPLCYNMRWVYLVSKMSCSCTATLCIHVSPANYEKPPRLHFFTCITCQESQTDYNIGLYTSSILFYFYYSILVKNCDVSQDNCHHYHQHSYTFFSLS